MTMLTKAVKALYAEYENRPEYAQGQMNGILAEELVRAVLQAIREPSEAMENAAFEVDAEAVARASAPDGDIELKDDGPLLIWQAMIDTALSD